MEIVLRRAAERDETFLRQVFQRTREGIFAGLPLDNEQKGDLLDMQYRAQRGNYAAEFPYAVNFVLEVNGEAVGRLTVNEQEELRLVDIAILPQHQNLGIGGAVIAKLQERAKDQGKSLALSVHSVNPATRLYERLGFREVGCDGLNREMRWP